MRQGCPARCTGMTAFVRGVMAAANAAGSRPRLAGSMSARTGRAPQCTHRAQRGDEGERRQHHFVARAHAECLEPHQQARPTRWPPAPRAARPGSRRRRSPNSRTLRPVGQPARAQHLGDGRQFGLAQVRPEERQEGGLAARVGAVMGAAPPAREERPPAPARQARQGLRRTAARIAGAGRPQQGRHDRVRIGHHGTRGDRAPDQRIRPRRERFVAGDELLGQLLARTGAGDDDAGAAVAAVGIEARQREQIRAPARGSTPAPPSRGCRWRRSRPGPSPRSRAAPPPGWS